MGEGTMGGERNQGRTYRLLEANLLLPGHGHCCMHAGVDRRAPWACNTSSCCLLELVTSSCLSLLSGLERNQAILGQSIGWKTGKWTK